MDPEEGVAKGQDPTGNGQEQGPVNGAGDEQRQLETSKVSTADIDNDVGVLNGVSMLMKNLKHVQESFCSEEGATGDKPNGMVDKYNMLDKNIVRVRDNLIRKNAELEQARAELEKSRQWNKKLEAELKPLKRFRMEFDKCFDAVATIVPSSAEKSNVELQQGNSKKSGNANSAEGGNAEVAKGKDTPFQPSTESFAAAVGLVIGNVAGNNGRVQVATNIVEKSRGLKNNQSSATTNGVGNKAATAAILDTTEKKKFKCNHCLLRFANASCLTDHLLKKHAKCASKSNRKEPQPSTSSAAYAATAAKSGRGKRINRKAPPKKTRQMVKRKRSGCLKFRCLICEMPFNFMSTLNVHMISHSDERPYKCPVCQKTFTQKGNLNLHIRRFHPTYKGPIEETEKGTTRDNNGSGKGN